MAAARRSAPRRYLQMGLRLRRAHLDAAWWSLCALREVRRELPTHGLRTFVREPPANLPPRTVSVVRIVLRLGRATCLQRSIVLQEWLAAHGRRYDIVVGVPKKLEDFEAHAWLDRYDPPGEGADYLPLTRRTPR